MFPAELIVWILDSWFRLALLSVSLICLIDLTVKKWLKSQEFRRQVDQLPGPPAKTKILGNIPSQVLSLLIPLERNPKLAAKKADLFYLSQIQSLLGHTFIYRKEPFFRLWLGQEPVICVYKPETVEQVLSDNFLLEKSYHYDFLRPWLGNGLLTSPGRIWRPRRKLLVPSFHFNILRAFVPVFDRKSKLMVRNINRKLIDKFKSNNCTKEEDETGSKKRKHEIDKITNSSIVVDITPIITACTLDAICETIMGVSIDAQESSENDYCKSIQIVGETFLERIIQPRYWLDWIFRFTELGKLYAYHLGKLHSFTRRIIAEKKAAYLTPEGAPSIDTQTNTNGSCGPDVKLLKKLKVLSESTVDSYEKSTASTGESNSAENKPNVPKLPKAFLDLLLEKVMAANGVNKDDKTSAAAATAGGHDSIYKLTDEQIREEVDTFMFEGHDTTAMALSWTIFLLGHNLEVQTKLHEEIDEFYRENFANKSNKQAGEYGDLDQLDLDQLKQLKYLDCVIKEALRLCPSVPFIGRKTTKEMDLANYKVPPGCFIFVLIYQLHRNPEIFPQPEKFKPDRFLPENTLGRHPFAYVPFSAGPRNCIGQKFAMAEMKTILLHLLRNFSFESQTPLEKAEVRMEMVMRPKSALNVRIRRRFVGP